MITPFRSLIVCIACTCLSGYIDAQSLKNIYANIPSLEELSGVWMSADTMSITPSVRNFRAQALLNRDLSSVSWFASAPYSGGYHTGVLRVNGSVPRAGAFRWFPWQALRKVSTATYAIQSAVRMVPDENVVMWKIEITNNSNKDQRYNLEQDLIGFISRYDAEQWPWPYPYPTLKGKLNERTDEIVNVIENIGQPPAASKAAPADVSDKNGQDSASAKWPSDIEILQSGKYHIVESGHTELFIADNETSCVSGFALIDAPDKILSRNSGGTAYWSLKLKPGETKKIRFILSYGDTRKKTAAILNRYKNNFDPAFAHIPDIWKARWKEIFTPGNKIISASFPVLETRDAAARKVYYTGPLTMLYLLHTNLPAHKRIYLTGGPRWGATVTFFWDITEWSTLWAVADPVMMKEQLRSWISIDPSKHFGKDNYGGNGVGNGYVANYWALFQLLRSYITISKDYAFLNEEVNGKKLIGHLTDYAYNWKNISIYGQEGAKDDVYKLADFGSDPWNLLECVPTYIHIVPSFNAGYIWMMRETAKFYRHLGENAKADSLNTEAAEMMQRVLKLYAGNGVWNSLYPDNKKVEVRHVMDFMFFGKYLNDDLSENMKNEMVDFAYDELITDTWMRAQSLKDIAAKNSDRPDHGPLGAYDGWPAGTMDALSQMGHTAKAFDFYRSIAPVTSEGCWAQAHELWGENKYNKHARVRIPERGWTCREASVGIELSQIMLKDFFGFYPSIDGAPLQNTKEAINFSGTLYNVLYGGKYYHISCNKGKVNMQPASDTNLSNLKYTVEPAPEWTALFKRSSGWYGADGIFSIPQNGKENVCAADSDKNLLIFSDSMVGEIENGKPVTSKNMMHNTVAIIKGAAPKPENIKFYWNKDSHGEPETMFIPNTASAQKGDYYWLGDGFVNTARHATYIFAYKMRNLDPKDDWSFTLTKTNLVVIPAGSKPPFVNHRQIETPLSFDGPSADEKGTFGAGIFVNTKQAGVAKADGYIYVYGIKGKAKNLVVARVKPEDFDNFGKWRFWNGREWDADMKQSASVTDGVSDELSLSPLPDGRYILVFQQNGMGAAVGMRIGASPVGPFGSSIKLWDCPEAKENKNYFTYNAKAHPSLSKPGELLISYNVNSFEYWKEIQKNPNLYRPRFIKLKFQ